MHAYKYATVVDNEKGAFRSPSTTVTKFTYDTWTHWVPFVKTVHDYTDASV